MTQIEVQDTRGEGNSFMWGATNLWGVILILFAELRLMATGFVLFCFFSTFYLHLLASNVFKIL